MKFTCEKYLLSLAVSTAGRAAASKSPVAALEGLLLEAGESGVRVTGFDLKKGIYTNFAADVSEPGSVVISARLFGEIVRKLPDGIVTVASDEYNTVNVRCGNADYNVAGTPSEDYPELPSMDHGSSITISQDTLASMISQTSFAISANESRPVYTGALLEVENGTLTMVAVDGYRLALRRESVDSCDVDAMRFIVPGSALADAEKIFVNADDQITITVGSKHVCFSVGDTVLISRRLEGEFLNYRKTVPFEFPGQRNGPHDLGVGQRIAQSADHAQIRTGRGVHEREPLEPGEERDILRRQIPGDDLLLVARIGLSGDGHVVEDPRLGKRLPGGGDLLGGGVFSPQVQKLRVPGQELALVERIAGIDDPAQSSRRRGQQEKDEQYAPRRTGFRRFAVFHFRQREPPLSRPDPLQYKTSSAINQAPHVLRGGRTRYSYVFIVILYLIYFFTYG